MHHGKNTNQFIRFMEIYLIVFILLQPILDITAYINLPISEPIRVLTLFLGLIYVLLSPYKRAKLFSISYIVLLGIFMGLSLGNNLMVKEPVSLITETTYIIKTSYFLIMLIVYYFVFRSLSERIDWRSKLQKYLTINLTVIGVVMVIASLTDTGKRSYGMLDKEGHSGWFYSANELSAILGIGFAIMILFLMKQPTVKKLFLLIPAVIVTAWAIFTVGTKVGLGSILMVLALGSLIALFEAFKKKAWLNAIVLPALFVVSILAIPYTAVGNNMDLTYENNNPAPDTETDGEGSGDNDTGIDEGTGGAESEEEDDSSGNADATALLSNRDVFLGEKVEQFRQAPISQKLLGMGRGGNYEDEPSLVEMDLMDWFLNFGILGFVILMTPVVYFIYMILKNLITSRFRVLTGENLFIGVAVGIGLGTAFLAGHVLSAPAAGIYLALLLAYLYRSTKPSQKISPT
ncbi:O-antigen ligase family protein [Halobacillus sp. A1]|uniref:O-antigen ligase family protein n=1 Tax=Halobacillus sp. A1 TaxID=2880262 RepID=UPI0020A6A21A|nr:O-antigen ligase family protein [Halobacillus sp. A1]MCP3031465.1 O-antigen ligase family protein [Halobacillus sp. A1]